MYPIMQSILCSLLPFHQWHNVCAQLVKFCRKWCYLAKLLKNIFWECSPATQKSNKDGLREYVPYHTTWMERPRIWCTSMLSPSQICLNKKFQLCNKLSGTQSPFCKAILRNQGRILVSLCNLKSSRQIYTYPKSTTRQGGKELSRIITCIVWRHGNINVINGQFLL